MTNHARNGRAREYRVMAYMAKHGWILIARAAASKGPADLIMAHPDAGLALIQVGPKDKTLGPGERARLTVAADLCSAVPLLAQAKPGVGVSFWRVTNHPPRTWIPYDPANPWN